MRQARIVDRSSERLWAVRLAGVGREIVDDDEVEIRRRGHLAGAEFAERDDGDAAAAHLAVFRRKRVSDSRQQWPDEPLSQRAIGASCAVGIEPARQEIEADEEHLLGGEIARAVEGVLVTVRLGDIGLDALLHRALIQAFVEILHPAGIDCGVEDVRTRRDHPREPRRAAEHVAEQLAQARVRAQDRHELDRGRHARQRLVEGGERGVGIARAGEGFEQRRRKLRQHFAGARASDRGATPEMPAANGLRGGFRIVEPEAAKAD